MTYCIACIMPNYVLLKMKHPCVYLGVDQEPQRAPTTAMPHPLSNWQPIGCMLAPTSILLCKVGAPQKSLGLKCLSNDLGNPNLEPSHCHTDDVGPYVKYTQGWVGGQLQEINFCSKPLTQRR